MKLINQTNVPTPHLVEAVQRAVRQLAEDHFTLTCPITICFKQGPMLKSRCSFHQKPGGKRQIVVFVYQRRIEYNVILHELKHAADFMERGWSDEDEVAAYELARTTKLPRAQQDWERIAKRRAGK